MLFDDLYVDLAELISLGIAEPYNAPDIHYRAARDRLIDVSSIDHVGNLSLIVVTLLSHLQRFFIHSRRRVVTQEYLTKFVSVINNFVIRHINDNLDNFINNLDWTLGTVPLEWKIECETANFDTSNWI
jgi:hypothetical protein